MPVYDGVNGVVRKRKEWPVGINGVVRQQKEHWAGIDGVQRKIFSKGTAVGSLPVGFICQIEEGGSPTDYIVVHQGLPSSIYDSSCNGTWLLRKDVISTSKFSSAGNAYETSSVLSYLDVMFIMRLPKNIQDALFQKNAKIPYRKNGGSGGTDMNGANGIDSRVFLLSAFEIGFVDGWIPHLPNDGARLSYFNEGTSETANQKRIAMYNGSPNEWWLRSPNTTSRDRVVTAQTTGVEGTKLVSGSIGIRPAFILPSDFEI